MNKSVRIFVAVLALTVTFVGYAYALPANVGDLVTFIDYDATYQGNFEFSNDTQATDNGGVPHPIYSFCLEKNEIINYGRQYVVSNISKVAYLGGVNGGVAGDPISDATQWLYYNFLGEKLSVGGTTYFNNADGISALQDAFWHLEDEIVLDLTDDSLASALVNLAMGASYDDLGHIMVMNLQYLGKYSQSQLIGDTPDGDTPVPEPATMVLLGSGLIGLAFYRRKMKK